MITWKRVQYLIRLFSLLACFMYALLMFYQWYLAFFGGFEAALMTINGWNEMWLEFYAWLIVIPLIVYGFYLNVIEVFHG